MKKRILATPLLVVIIFILVGAGIVTASVLIGGAGGTEEVNLQKGLVGWWKFNGNAKDATPNSNHGTVTGAVLTTDRKGQANKAYSFNGTSDYVSVNDSASLDIANAITVEAWVKSNNSSGSLTRLNRILEKNDSYAFDFNHDLWGKANFGLNFTVGGFDNVQYVSALPADTWMHLVGTYDGSTMRVYLNGVLDNSHNVSKTIVTNNNKAYIGTYGTVPTGTYNFSGLVDDVRVYNRALSQAEITALYESYDPGIVVSDLQKGLVGNWKFDGNAKDSTPYGNHGTVTGAVLTTDRKGQANKAYSFNGVDDNVTVANSSSTDITTAITLEAWVKPNDVSTKSYRGIVSKHNSYKIRMNDSSAQNFYTFIYVGSDYLPACNSVTAPVAGTWYHLATTYNGANIKFYVNGILENTCVKTGSIDVNTDNLSIGDDIATEGREFNGLIDDVRVYNRALSQAEITALYESYDPGIVVSDLQKGLVGQWKFDGNAKDSTPYGNHGTVTGAVLTTDRKSQANKAYSFNGTDDYVDAGNNASLQLTGAFTAEAWVKTPLTVSRYFLGKSTDQGTSGNGWGMLIYSTGAVAFQVNAGGAGNYDFFKSANGVISADTWYHMVGVFKADGSRTKLYLNGSELTNSQGSGIAISSMADSGSSLTIGRTTTSYFNGLVDEVRVYNRVLSQAEITALYESY